MCCDECISVPNYIAIQIVLVDFVRRVMQHGVWSLTARLLSGCWKTDSNCVFILPGLSDRLNVWELLLERDERSNQHRRIGVAKTWFNYHADGVVVWHGTNARHQNGIAFSNGSMHDISNIKKTIKSRKPFLFR